jgi:2-polyprenyl-3-methyl-5-hydroxy-6-metoxy-1,4-benzoquinol methylase
MTHHAETDIVGSQSSSGGLTDTAFWNDYWGRFSLPATIDESHSFDRALARALRDLLGQTSGGGRALEVGCAPGRWMAFLAREFDLRVSGIEYTADGAEATRRNLTMLGVDYDRVDEADFFALTPSPSYDVVVSFGFVEHFTDVHGVVARQAEWLRPGGLLLVGVPNFAGVHGRIQKVLDPEILTRHNLTIMNASELARIGGETGLVTESATYLGSFEPSLPITRPGVSGVNVLVAKVVLRAAWILRRAPLIGRMFDGWNGPSVSSYILASYRKPA